MFDLTADQSLLHETTRRYLDAECAPARLRDLAGTKAGYEPTYWQQGAGLGWTSLVVPEAAGGGSVTGNGFRDLLLIGLEFGRHAAPGPLAPVNVVAAAVSRWGSEAQKDAALPGLLAGEQVAAWGLAEPPPHSGFGQVQLAAGREAGSYVLSGTKTAVEGGGEAEWFLLTARDEEDLVHFLVPRDTPGLTVTPLEGLDMTRRFARLDLDGLRIDDGDRLDGAGRDALEWLSDLAVLVQLGEMVGAMQWALDTTLEWSFNRYSFGRPLASYQEIKHRFADMKMWLEASYAITDQAAQAMDDGRPERAEIVSTAKLYVGTQGVELMQDCVQLHGGIGVTFDLDLHLFLRRVTTDVALFGLPSEHAARIGRLIHSGRAE